MRPIRKLAAAAAIALVVPHIASAQDAAERPAASAPERSAPEQGDPEARRRALNSAEAAAAQQQVSRNQASQAQYEAALALNEMQTRRDSAAYDATLERHDAAEQDYRADRKQWEVRNPSCWKGDAMKCPADPQAPGTGGS
ncbi:hypothetical protein [Novosphingobium guangzhouense]|uniref:Cell wall hydrolase n=1 Tax=Novosphingobium guangzhouense TaxID=1850347 RepID=A0A2K2FT76_9SPHN|nr:hypothetical protein [Novosphingobium guangzhouense]PNU01997.1 hypothetical protein A8V01_11150 [Novosphingobium guangzhouense]